VLLLTPLFAWHYRLANSQNAYRPNWGFSWTLEFFIWIPPTLIVVGLGILLWHGARQFDPNTPIASPVAPLEVQAVGFDWKWLFIYPDAGIATVPAAYARFRLMDLNRTPNFIAWSHRARRPLQLVRNRRPRQLGLRRRPEAFSHHPSTTPQFVVESLLMPSP
jgi:hypothetical protein